MAGRRRFAVDWDGTCVTDSWPAMGTWNPGAIEALRKLLALGEVVIHTCRVAPVEPDEITYRSDWKVQCELNGIREMLDIEGLCDVQVWSKPWKPSADAYIDNKAIPYDSTSGWDGVIQRLEVPGPRERVGYRGVLGVWAAHAHRLLQRGRAALRQLLRG